MRISDWSSDVCSSDLPVSLSLSPEFHLRALTIKSVFVGSVGGDELARWTDARRFETALDIVRGIDPANLISQRLPFDRAADAYRLLVANPAQAPAVILDYRSEARRVGNECLSTCKTP